jgi:hypothetical protein
LGLWVLEEGVRAGNLFVLNYPPSDNPPFASIKAATDFCAGQEGCTLTQASSSTEERFDRGDVDWKLSESETVNYLVAMMRTGGMHPEYYVEIARQDDAKGIFVGGNTDIKTMKFMNLGEGFFNYNMKNKAGAPMSNFYTFMATMKHEASHEADWAKKAGQSIGMSVPAWRMFTEKKAYRIDDSTINRYWQQGLIKQIPSFYNSTLGTGDKEFKYKSGQ